MISTSCLFVKIKYTILLIGFDDYPFPAAAAGAVKVLGEVDVVAGLFQVFGLVLLKDLVRLFHVVYDHLVIGQSKRQYIQSVDEFVFLQVVDDAEGHGVRGQVWGFAGVADRAS
jgi:hypothetical protein